MGLRMTAIATNRRFRMLVFASLPLLLMAPQTDRPTPPRPPDTVNPAVPPDLSRIILRLLAKEPDNRYQSAEGLIRDLERVRDGRPWSRAGADDVALRLTEPSRLAGRENEIEELISAFGDALSGDSPGVLVSGESAASNPPAATRDQLPNDVAPSSQKSPGADAPGQGGRSAAVRRGCEAGVHHPFGRVPARPLLVLTVA